MKNALFAFMVCRLYLVLLVFIGFFIGIQVVNGQEPSGIHAKPDHEKRSCIQEVDGYAFLSEDMTLSQARWAAFTNAKRQAIETAQTFIKSKAKMENYVLKFDLVTSSAEGAVTILEQRDLGIEDNARYHVWIKAEVEYALSPEGMRTSEPDEMIKDKPLTVTVWTAKKNYREGEKIEIFIRGNRDFYARIVDITSSGDIIQLLPNDYRRINFFKSGEVYKIPDKEDRFDLKVSPPYGEDHIVVYASEVPLGAVEMERIGQGLGKYRGTLKNLSVQTRGISVVGSKQNDISGAEFYESTWTLTTSR